MCVAPYSTLREQPTAPQGSRTNPSGRAASGKAQLVVLVRALAPDGSGWGPWCGLFETRRITSDQNGTGAFGIPVRASNRDVLPHCYLSAEGVNGV